jgi:Uma2 family endonuclease
MFEVPSMATHTERPAAHDPAEVDHGSNPARDVYDRSSLTGDFMVMLADQTPENFERFAPESQYCEYINGIVYMPSPVTDRHQEQVGFLFHLLDGFRCERGGGVVLTGPAVLRLGEEWKPEPDVFVRPPADEGLLQPPALLVIEILSPSTRDHDLGRKRLIYQSAGIPEIWFFDERDRKVIVERRVDDRYQRAILTEGNLASTASLGFWIDVAWLWADSLPNCRRCLEMILKGPPA